MKSNLYRIYIASIVHSMGYGISFLLPLRIVEVGGDEQYVGQILGVAMVSALLSGFFSGHLTDLIGRVWSIVSAAIAQAIALVLIAILTEPNFVGILIGVGLGYGWAVFYLLTPIFTIKISPDDQRVKFLTIVSGLMMLGVGLGPVISRTLFTFEVPVDIVFLFGAFLSGLSVFLFISLSSVEKIDDNLIQGTASLSLKDIRSVFSSDAKIPILMIVIGGSIFGCLTNFQTVIAEAKKIDFSLFFFIFSITVVLSRLGLASKINSQPTYPTAIVLLLIMCAALSSYSYLPQSSLTFVITTIIFGVGYGLTYSVLNGIVANIRQTEHLQAALLIFPLAYFVGLYGFPFVGGWVLVQWNVTTLLFILTFLGLLNMSVAIYGYFQNLYT